MRLRKRKKLTNALLGFYQAVTTVFTGVDKFDDEPVKGLMLYAHINEIVNFHKTEADANNIEVGNPGKYYDVYIDRWNAHIRKKEDYFQELINTYRGKVMSNYII